ncbi:MAG TPA: hypothetical protein VL383_05110 [Gemmatimonadaceae bacterium]|nr:hypothetical protein [Gemmatimonadaceae bacterium]
MTEKPWRAGLIAGVALIAAAACSKNGNGRTSMDASLRSDLDQAGATSLELTPKAGRQMVVSPIEGGPRATPATAPHRVRSTVQRPAPRRTVAVRPDPAPSRAQPASEPAPAPPPQPARQSQPQQRQPGVYSTEAEIFRRMPWIRP